MFAGDTGVDGNLTGKLAVDLYSPVFSNQAEYKHSLAISDFMLKRPVKAR
ncbi:MAG: hypothetical protein IKL38_01365 [Firmicutes bacterium]|nr:hypothetical protein [Bacillota bacterium]